MKDSHDIFKEIGLEALKNLFGSKKTKDGEDKEIYFLLGLLLFFGSEGVKVAFRKNFGREGLNLAMIIGCVFCLGGISFFSFYEYKHPLDYTGYGSKNSFLATTVIFAFLSFYILVRGIMHVSKAAKTDTLSNYPGESSFLSFLKRDNWSDQQISFIWEPVFVIAMGACYCYLNLLGGLAFVISGLSVWGRYILEVIILNNPIAQKINDHSGNTEKKTNNRAF